MPLKFNHYQLDGLYDELLTPGHRARPGAGRLIQYLKSIRPADLNLRKEAAELAIKAMGITFTIYSEGENIDRQWPYDIIPRIIPSREWERIELGLKQRLAALNCFINDIYNRQQILKDRVVPRDLLRTSANYRKQCRGIEPVFGVWAHICGSDLIRDSDGTMYVLEDNLRVPSGVSYMLENRKLTKRVFPELFEDYNIVPTDDYPSNLFDTLSAISPRPSEYPEVVVLTPGIFNSAYFEHAFLAQQMGAELVEGSDLIVGDDDCVYMKNIEGLSRVDVIYRRIDDLFLDPEVFDRKSMLGVPGLMRAWKNGKVALANAPGAGVADDKVVYTYVPDMIRYYLGEDAIIPNVPSYSCDDPVQRRHVLSNLDKLVVKPANESGGYGMLVGPHSTRKQRTEMADKVKANPRNYIAQPVINLSTVPTLSGSGIEPRHVDLRPFTLQSDRSYVTAGGLTRVALVKGSLVVNSSQGGGSKDTWIVAAEN
ncbi:MAG: circularly permuted type 2 ATP-grasp protein [Gammaproteobacteria bacterium]|nr:circularly permuted type 2 ATP-grasp protein [Gammaproteobacteria bacterium]